jgi:predicted AAA+ superfamily ATPase
LNKQVRKKVYLFDNGFLNALSFKFFSEYWKLLENVVFVELYRRYWDNVFFLKNWSETDFVVNQKKAMIFQVCYNLNDENYHREIAWCLNWMKKFNINEAVLISFEQEDEIKIDWNLIKVIPFYKWVLEE